MTLLSWKTQLWLQGNVYLPHKNQDQQQDFWICLGLIINEKNHQVCEFCTSGLKSPLLPDIHIQQGARLYIFLILKECVNLRNRTRCPSFRFFQEFPCWPRNTEYNSQELIETSFFHPLQGKQGIGYHSFINMENQPPLSCTSFQSGLAPTVMSCLLLLYLTLQHCTYFVSLIKPLLFMKVGEKIYDRMEGKFLSASGLLKGKFVKQLLRLMAKFFSFLWNLRLKT